MSKRGKLNGVCNAKHQNCFTTPTSSKDSSTCRYGSFDYSKSGDLSDCQSPLLSNDSPTVFIKKEFSKRGSSRDALGSLREFNDFELIELLGNGFFGQVYKVREKPKDEADAPKEPLVMKIPIKHKQLCHHNAKRIAIKEDFMLRILSHPNIIRSRGICVQRTNTSWQLNLLIDYCDKGSLQQLIMDPNSQLSLSQMLRIGQNVSKALCYVHSEGYMHRDLTSMNILLQNQPGTQYVKAIVADFGLSVRIPEFPIKLEQVGSQNWMAPEVLKEEFYNEMADVFSFGIVLCQMIARIDADHDAGLFRTQDFGIDCENFKKKCPENTPPKLLQCAFDCCGVPYTTRPSFDSLCRVFESIIGDNDHLIAPIKKSDSSVPELSLKDIGMNYIDYNLLLGYALIFSFIDTVNSRRNFYDILGVPKHATVDQIKSAYRKNAKILHPDVSDEPDSQERFSELGQAYEVLSDREKRSIYDKHGEDGLKNMGNGFGTHDPFSSFFGDFFGGGTHEHDAEETPKGADVVIDLYVTLEEIYNGKFVEVKRKKSQYKQTSGTRECNCRNEMRTQQLGAGRFQMFQMRVCDQCPNVKLVRAEKMLEVEIEVGMDNGQEIRFAGEGEPHIEGEPGDLIFKVRVQPHNIFERRGLDLYTNVTISLVQALSGFEMEIVHLDGHKVQINRDKITWPGARIRKRDEGMISLTDNKVKGILYITFDVEFPRGELTSEQKASLSNLLNQDNISQKVYNGLQGY